MKAFFLEKPVKFK